MKSKTLLPRLEEQTASQIMVSPMVNHNHTCSDGAFFLSVVHDPEAELKGGNEACLSVCFCVGGNQDASRLGVDGNDSNTSDMGIIETLGNERVGVAAVDHQITESTKDGPQFRRLDMMQQFLQSDEGWSGSVINEFVDTSSGYSSEYIQGAETFDKGAETLNEQSHGLGNPGF